VKINYDTKTVEGFGEEWEKFDQAGLNAEELADGFDNYFGIFPWDDLSEDAQGFDMGCGSGRWAKLVAPRVGRLYCIDASRKALEVAKRNLADLKNCEFINASVENIPLDDNSMDFGYSLGVLHHIPDTIDGIKACVRKLKEGAPFLIYLY
jgi:ubiquinone/menaquinone biosynthesis C-methylase UbiE